MDYNPAFVYPASIEGTRPIIQTAKNIEWPAASSKDPVGKIMTLRNANAAVEVWERRAPMCLAATSLPKN